MYVAYNTRSSCKISVSNNSIVPIASCVLTVCNSMTVCNAIHFADVNYLGVLVADNLAFSAVIVELSFITFHL